MSTMWGGVPLALGAPDPAGEPSQGGQGGSGAPAASALPVYAGFLRRLAASLLDSLLVGVLLYLLLPIQPVLLQQVLWGPLPAYLSHGGTSVAVVCALLLGLALMQAYLGATPGKLTIGIAVVRLHALRAIGLWRTVVRELAHIVDTLSVVGWFLPVFREHRRQTFADSLMKTVVLQTSRPLPYRRHPTSASSATGWQRARRPVWLAVSRWAVATVTVAAAAFGLFPVERTAASGSCEVNTREQTVRSNVLTGLHGQVVVATPVTRLGVTRAVEYTEPSVVFRWVPQGVLPETATFRVELSSNLGTTRTYAYEVRDGVIVSGAGSVLGDGMAVRLPISAVGAADGAWTWTISIDGEPGAGTCFGRNPLDPQASSL